MDNTHIWNLMIVIAKLLVFIARIVGGQGNYFRLEFLEAEMRDVIDQAKKNGGNRT